MKVKITDFKEDGKNSYIDYEVSGLSSLQISYLDDNLSEETDVLGDILKIRSYFRDFFPFQSDIARIKLDDFIAREEIEMTVFLSSFLEDI